MSKTNSNHRQHMHHTYASMAPSSTTALLCLAVVMSSAVVTASSAPTLEETCKSAGQEEKFCVEVLSSSPAADTRGLARAAVLLAKDNATGTLAHLSRIYNSEEYLKSETPALTQCIEECKKKYSDVVTYLNNAAYALDKSSFDEARVLIGGAQSEANMCQRGCNTVGQKELTACIRDVDRFCTVATAITRLLIQPH